MLLLFSNARDISVKRLSSVLMLYLDERVFTKMNIFMLTIQ